MAIREDEIAGLDTTAQADLVARGEVSPLELLDAAIARIEKINPAINAIVSKTYDKAREWAQSSKLPKGPFRGVPFALKDLGAYQERIPHYLGNKALKAIDYRGSHDSVLGARFRQAGLITLGVTNTPELGNQSSTVPEAHGVCRNPWNLKYSAAGSSTGSAAAVACGMLPMAHGNDGGGSLRMPASWCGVVGLKPSRGRMPGTAGHIINRRAVEFAITRTVRDTAHLLDAVHGATSADLFHLPLPSRPFATELEVRPRPLRIGVMTAVPGGIDLHPECKEAIDRTVAILSDLGHNVEETWPNALTQERKDLYAPISSALFRLDFAHIERMLGRPLREDDVEPYHWEVADLGNACGSAIDLLLAQEDDHAWCAEVLGWWQQGYDLLLTPTTAFPPWPNAELTLAMDTATIGKRSRCLTALTRPFNLTGQPAITLPLHWTKEGLPLGVQFVADMGREDLLIQLAAQLEEAMPWRDRFPLMLSEEK